MRSGAPIEVDIIMSRSLRAVLATGTAALAIAIAGCSANSEPAGEAPAPEVSVAPATLGPVQLTDNLPGRVVAFRVAEIRPQVGGIIQRRLFTEGAMVRAGQALFQINSAPFRAEADSAAASLQRAEVTRDKAKTQLDRLTSLVEIDAVSQQAYDAAAGALAQAEADVGVARANLSRQRLNVGFATITSPISGRIGATNVTEGALVSESGTTALATVQQIDRVYVDVSQPAARFEALRQMGQGSTMVELLDGNGEPLGLTGRLLFSELVVDPGTDDMKARILVDNARGRLLPGMFVRARMPRGPEQNLPRVPQQAVAFSGGKPQVMVVDAQGNVATREIVVGEVVDNQYVVLSGLRANETVIVEGRDRAAMGGRVTPVRWRPAAPRAAAPAAAAPKG